MTERLALSWADVERRASEVARHVGGLDVRGVYGIPRGGVAPAALVARHLGVPLVSRPLNGRVLVVDDLIDSGSTLVRLDHIPLLCAPLWRKSWSPKGWCTWSEAVPHDAWVVFPWEEADEAPAVDAVLRLLQVAGLDTTRPEIVAAAGRATDRVARTAATLVEVEAAIEAADRVLGPGRP